MTLPERERDSFELLMRYRAGGEEREGAIRDFITIPKKKIPRVFQ